MEDKLFIIFVLVCSILLVIAATIVVQGEESADEYWLVQSKITQLGLAWIPVYYVDEITYEMCPTEHESRGCYYHGPDRRDVHIVKDKTYEWASQGCTVRDHEYFHAMGYAHGVGPLSTTCPNPWNVSNDNTNAGYEEDNINHWDPMYEHTAFESDPKCTTYMVNRPDNCGR